MHTKRGPSPQTTHTDTHRHTHTHTDAHRHTKYRPIWGRAVGEGLTSDRHRKHRPTHFCFTWPIGDLLDIAIQLGNVFVASDASHESSAGHLGMTTKTQTCILLFHMAHVDLL